MMRHNNKIWQFSLQSYKDILMKAKAEGYKFPKLAEFKHWINKYSKFLLLRHDIDVSPLNALKMAETEKSLGITSTYYVMLRSVFYNPAASPYFEALRNIIDMGHEVGLHYDNSLFRDSKIDINKRILDDKKALEKVLSTKIRSISQHRVAIYGKIKRLSGYIDAYDDELMKKVTYLSDSGFMWRDRTLVDLIGSTARIYILIHPTTWAYRDLGMAKTYKRSSKLAQELINHKFEEFIGTTFEYLNKRNNKEID